MKALIQRVAEAQVAVEGEIVGRIGPGMVVFLGVARDDTPEKADRLAERLFSYRIFEDEGGRMNRSIKETEGEVLAISQFTLVADVAKGTRPSFTPAADPEMARRLYGRFIDRLASAGAKVQTGRFGERMLVSLHNDGPVTFMLET